MTDKKNRLNYNEGLIIWNDMLREMSIVIGLWRTVHLLWRLASSGQTLDNGRFAWTPEAGIKMKFQKATESFRQAALR